MTSSPSIFLFPSSGASALTSEFLAGHTDIHDIHKFLVPIASDQTLKDLAASEVDLELLQALCEEILGRKDDFEDFNEMDGWLAPRLHFALRIPRRLAADSRFWTWLAVTVFKPYVQHRWSDAENGSVTKFRFVDSNMNLRNGISRLWWGAEMVRNGPDYAAVSRLFSRVRTAQFALELAYSAFKPAAIAFVNVCVDTRPELSDSEKKELSKTIRAYLSTVSLEMLGFDKEHSTKPADFKWREHRPTLEEVLAPLQDLRGPKDSYASEVAVQSLTRWFSELASTRRIVAVASK